jgi:hypothetical protein
MRIRESGVNDRYRKRNKGNYDPITAVQSRLSPTSLCSLCPVRAQVERVSVKRLSPSLTTTSLIVRQYRPFYVFSTCTVFHPGNRKAA